LNVREVGLVNNVHDIEKTVLKSQNGNPLKIRISLQVEQGSEDPPRPFGGHSSGENGKIVDDDDVVSGILLLRKGAESDSVLEAIHAKVQRFEQCRSSPKA
jgi:cobalt-zinc-cadmium resistance protein CzcA